MAQDVFSMAHKLTIFEPIWPKLQNLSKTQVTTYTVICTLNVDVDIQYAKFNSLDTFYQKLAATIWTISMVIILYNVVVL